MGYTNLHTLKNIIIYFKWVNFLAWKLYLTENTENTFRCLELESNILSKTNEIKSDNLTCLWNIEMQKQENSIEQ